MCSFLLWQELEEVMVAVSRPEYWSLRSSVVLTSWLETKASCQHTKISCTMHSLSLQSTSSKSKLLQAKDNMTGRTRQGRLRFRKTGKPYCQSSTRCLHVCGRHTAVCGHRGEDEALVGYFERANNGDNFLAATSHSAITCQGQLQCYVPVGNDPE